MKSFQYCMAIVAMMLASCSNHSGEAPQNMQQPGEQTATDNEKNVQREDTIVGTFDSVGTGSGVADNAPLKNSSNPDWDKKIIKTADVELQLDDYKKFNSTIHASLKQFGAYVAAEKQTESDYRIENSLTIKVPVDQFDALLNSLTGDGIKLMAKNISSEDVTGEVVDTRARIQAKMAVREKYLELLKQARNMNDILQVQGQINDIQENIEAANGRIQYLQHAAAYSTINLNYYQYFNGRTADDIKPDFFTKMTRAFSTGTSVIANLFLFCISIWPFIFAAVIAWFYLKRVKVKKG